jgi:hypothetical protein
MPEYADIYVISEKRNFTTVINFLDQFLPEREESADEYELPQYSDSPDLIFSRANDLIEYCSNNESAENSIYWRALKQKKPEHGMVFFLRDGNVIFGLSTDASDIEFARQLLIDLKKNLGSKLGYITHEAPPAAANLNEFKQQIEIHAP